MQHPFHLTQTPVQGYIDIKLYIHQNFQQGLGKGGGVIKVYNPCSLLINLTFNLKLQDGENTHTLETFTLPPNITHTSPLYTIRINNKPALEYHLSSCYRITSKKWTKVEARSKSWNFEKLGSIFYNIIYH